MENTRRGYVCIDRTPIVTRRIKIAAPGRKVDSKNGKEASISSGMEYASYTERWVHKNEEFLLIVTYKIEGGFASVTVIHIDPFDQGTLETEAFPLSSSYDSLDQALSSEELQYELSCYGWKAPDPTGR